MACKGCLECLLRLLNFLLTLVGLAMVGYGIYMFVVYKQSSTDTFGLAGDLAQFGRPLMIAVFMNSNILDNLPKAWFIYLFIGVGAILFIISVFGCVGAATGNGCCLSCYSVLVFLIILVQLGLAAFINFDKSWEAEIPTDKTGDFDMIYDFLKQHWNIAKWVALGAVILEALVFLLALLVRAANSPADYDSDDEFINTRQSARQPLIISTPPATGVPVAAGALDNRPSRNDAWSTRMREKYGLDTSEFTYNAAEAGRFQPVNAQPAEEKGRCTIM